MKTALARHALLVLAAAAVALPSTGCDSYKKPYRPLPDTFEVQTLDGTTLRKADLVGHPWVINIWVPG